MSVGTYELFYSLRTVLETEVTELTSAQMIYDGVSIGELAKPFATIEQLLTGSQILSAGRKSYEHSYRFQIGLYARNFPEKLKLEEKFRAVLSSAEGIPLFGADLLPTGKYVVCDVSEFTPIGNDNVANTTNNHHGYFDVAVFILRDNGATTFTQ